MTAVVEVDAAALPERLPLGAGRSSAFVLVRVGRRVAGAMRLSAPGGVLTRAMLVGALARDERVAARVARLRTEEALLTGERPALPSWTVAICTRARPQALAGALEAVIAAAPPGGEIVVVDNDPDDDGTRRVVDAHGVGYVVEPVRGLNRARARALREATGDVVLFTDDDARVDGDWVSALLEPFATARVRAVCGLVVPASLDSPASEWFERLGGMGRGFDHLLVDATKRPAADAGMLGAGANLAVDRDVALAVGAFVPSLDRGTPARCGGDSYALYRILRAGHRVAYTPDAVVWHEHRASWDGLRATLRDHNAGGVAMLLRCLVDDRDPEAAAVAARRLMRDHLGPLTRSVRRRGREAPVDLRLAALAGWPLGAVAYARTRRVQP